MTHAASHCRHLTSLACCPISVSGNWSRRIFVRLALFRRAVTVWSHGYVFFVLETVLYNLEKVCLHAPLITPWHLPLHDSYRSILRELFIFTTYFGRTFFLSLLWIMTWKTGKDRRMSRLSKTTVVVVDSVWNVNARLCLVGTFDYSCHEIVY